MQRRDADALGERVLNHVQLPKPQQHRSEPAHAAHLPSAERAAEVDHVLGGDADGLQRAKQFCRALAEDVVGDAAAPESNSTPPMT